VKIEFDGNGFVKMEKIDLLQRKMLEDVLHLFGVEKAVDTRQANTRSWVIDDAFVLKSNEKQAEFNKSILLNRLLLSEGVPVIEYLTTRSNEHYAFHDNKYWCLMKKIKGAHLDPFEGNAKGNGILLGRAVAKIHKALKSIEGKIEVWDNDFFTELSSWIVPELEKSGTSFDSALMERIYAFEPVYRTLPRQIIHRDMHPGNLLFESGVFTGYLDFDLSQRNVRIFDIVYLGCGLLVDNYKDETRLRQWRDIFAGIIQGYAELSPLSADELDSIPVLLLFDEVLFTAFFFSIDQPVVAKSCIEMTKWLYENISAPVKPVLLQCVETLKERVKGKDDV
jgi:Ser/Thr protein kinase RdoA (MazF antagonist)